MMWVVNTAVEEWVMGTVVKDIPGIFDFLHAVNQYYKLDLIPANFLDNGCQDIADLNRPQKDAMSELSQLPSLMKMLPEDMEVVDQERTEVSEQPPKK